MQGIDRAYTINGWTKSLNVPSLLAADDPGGDGKSGANHEHVGRDAFGMVLGYHGKDFVHAGSVIDSVGAGSWQQLPQYGLYNGNIASWSWNTRKTDGTLLGALASTYRYDLLNRLRADTVRTRGVSSWDSPASKFRSAYTYDGNGNILTLDRRDDAGSHLDQLRYRYTPGMNRMTHVDELGGSTVTAGDIEDQDTLNYAYDATGNMTQDVSEGINTSGIVWTPSNKIRTITKAGSSPTSKLEYLYDGVGNRVVKRYYEPSNTLVKTTWYVRDAKGNVLGIYEKLASSGDVAAKENPVYGSSRIGEWRTGAVYSSSATDTLVTNDVIYSRLLGNRRYELTDHLDNVRVAVSDVLLDHSGSPDAEVVSYTDYHPYGMAMTNRTWQADGYRFGFNGKENDNDVKGTGNQVDFGARAYDPRLGRWMSTDPLEAKYTGWSPYHGMANSPIMIMDGDGREWEVTFRNARAQDFFKETIALIFDRKVEAQIVQNANDASRMKVSLQFVGDNTTTSLNLMQRAMYDKLSEVITSPTVLHQNVALASTEITMDAYSNMLAKPPAIDIHDIFKAGELMGDYKWSAAYLIHAVREHFDRAQRGSLDYTTDHEAAVRHENEILGFNRVGVGGALEIQQGDGSLVGVREGVFKVPYEIPSRTGTMTKTLEIRIENGVFKQASMVDGNTVPREAKTEP